MTLRLAEEELTRNVPRVLEDLLRALGQLPALIDAFAETRGLPEASLRKPVT